MRMDKTRAWIELDRAALAHNVAVLSGLLPRGCALMPAVKANAYGHGAVLISRELNALGVDHFCVATAPEGVELRAHGVEGEILVLGYTHPEQFPLLNRYSLTQTVLDEGYARLLNGCGETLDVHVKLDTGMHRLGERSERLDALCRIFACENLRVTGAFTHLCADDTRSPRDKAFTQAQGRAFYDAVARLRAMGHNCGRVHLLASYGLLNYPELGGDYARIGIALYGVLSTKADEEASALDLRPVLSLKARVALVKDLYRGEGAGYGLQYTAPRDGRLAVLAIGYADGLPRGLSCGAGSALIRGHRVPIVGRVCMDQALVDVTALPEVRAGDEAVLIGADGGEAIAASALAEATGTITNELLSRLGGRLARGMA